MLINIIPTTTTTTTPPSRLLFITSNSSTTSSNVISSTTLTIVNTTTNRSYQWVIIMSVITILVLISIYSLKQYFNIHCGDGDIDGDSDGDCGNHRSKSSSYYNRIVCSDKISSVESKTKLPIPQPPPPSVSSSQTSEEFITANDDIVNDFNEQEDEVGVVDTHNNKMMQLPPLRTNSEKFRFNLFHQHHSERERERVQRIASIIKQNPAVEQRYDMVLMDNDVYHQVLQECKEAGLIERKSTESTMLESNISSRSNGSMDFIPSSMKQYKLAQSLKAANNKSH